MHSVWRPGGGASFLGGETNDYYTQLEKLEDGRTKFSSTRQLNTGDPYDFTIVPGIEINMAFSIVYNG